MTIRKTRNIRQVMELQFACRKCGGEVDVDLAEIAEEPNIVCPDCGEEPEPTLIADVAGGIEELLATVGRLRSFYVRLELDSSEDRPQVYLEEEIEEDDDQDEEDFEDDY